jgi:hypothetical protein
MKIFRRLQQKTVKNDAYIPGSNHSSLLVKRQSEKSTGTCTDGDSVTVVSDGSERGPSRKRNVQFVTSSTLTKRHDCEWCTDDVDNTDIWYTDSDISSFKEEAQQIVQALIAECHEKVGKRSKSDGRGTQLAWMLAITNAFKRCQEIKTRQGMNELYQSASQLNTESLFDLAQWTAYKVTGTSSSTQRKRLYSAICRLQNSKLAKKGQLLEEEIRHASTQVSLSSKLFAGFLGCALQKELTKA